MVLGNQAPLNDNDVNTNQAAFKNIQGYTIVRHGRGFVRLVLLTFPGKSEALRRVLTKWGGKATNAFDLYQTLQDYLKLRNQAARLVTEVGLNPVDVRASQSAAHAARATAALFKAQTLAEPVFATGLSFAGVKILGVSPGVSDEAWEAGFRKRYTEIIAKGENLPASGPYHAVLVIAANDQKVLNTHTDLCLSDFAGLATAVWEDGEAKPSEHFGFTDNISQPQIFAMEQPASIGNYNPFTPISRFIFAPTGGTPDEYASFMAYMKIQQDVATFDAMVELGNSNDGHTPDDLRTWTIGRSREGVPALGGRATENDFNYSGDPDCLKCPMGAHIRKANRRDKDETGVRILRRGVLYSKSDTDRGLLFQSFQSELVPQFEQILGKWLLNPESPGGGAGQDAIMGARNSLPMPANLTPTPLRTVQRLTHVLAGEYFYFPSIPWLTRL